MLAAIDFGALLDVIWISLIAGVGITTIFSVVVYAGARAGEARRDGRTAAAYVFVGLSALALLVFAAGVSTGVAIMLNK